MPAAWAAAAAARSLAVGGYYEGLAKSLKIQVASTYETRVCFASSVTLLSNFLNLCLLAIWTRAQRLQPTRPPHLQLEAALPLRMDLFRNPKRGDFICATFSLFSSTIFLVVCFNFGIFYIIYRFFCFTIRPAILTIPITPALP
jgi:hypothetical protein